MRTNFDPPSDPYGNDRQCHICDSDLVYDGWTKEWYCPDAENHPVRKMYRACWITESFGQAIGAWGDLASARAQAAQQQAEGRIAWVEDEQNNKVV